MISECLLSSGECDEKYVLVDDILSASDYYEALGLSSDTTTDEIRRAYIRVNNTHTHAAYIYKKKNSIVDLHYYRKAAYATQINLCHPIPEQRKVFNVKLQN